MVDFPEVNHVYQKLTLSVLLTTSRVSMCQCIVGLSDGVVQLLPMNTGTEVTLSPFSGLDVLSQEGQDPS